MQGLIGASLCFEAEKEVVVEGMEQRKLQNVLRLIALYVMDVVGCSSWSDCRAQGLV